MKKNPNQVEPMTGDYRDNISLIKQKAKSQMLRKVGMKKQLQQEEAQVIEQDITVIRQSL